MQLLAMASMYLLRLLAMATCRKCIYSMLFPCTLTIYFQCDANGKNLSEARALFSADIHLYNFMYGFLRSRVWLSS